MTLPDVDIAGISIGAFALGALIVLASGDSRWRWSRRLAMIGAALLVLGESLPRHGDRFTLIAQTVTALVLCLGVFMPRRFSRAVAIAGGVGLMVLEGRMIWVEQGPGYLFRLAGFGAAALGLAWLMKASDKLFPSPEARGAAEVLRLRAEKRAALRTGTSA